MITATCCIMIAPTLQMRQLRLSAANPRISDFLVTLFDHQHRISSRFEHFSLGFEPRIPAAVFSHDLVLELQM